jgi:pimeloyl-ACP methyl ester carboxylesterase
MFLPLLFGAAMKSVGGQRMQQRVLTTRRFTRDRPDVASEWHDLLQGEPMNKRAVLRQMFAALQHNTKERLDRIAAPTLVITGNDDRLIPMQNSQYLASRIPRSHLRVLDGAGHDFPAQMPRVAADALLSFFAAE